MAKVVNLELLLCDGLRSHAVQEAMAASLRRARGFDAIAEQCLVIVYDATNDTLELGEGGRVTANGERIARNELRVETRLKLLDQVGSEALRGENRG